MNIALVGFDTEGRASYDYFTALGHQLTICDKNPAVVVPDGAASEVGEHYLDNLDRFDLVVRTAGLPPRAILEKNPSLGSKITTHINEFMKACPTKNIIGVTGTKGKGTTSTLIARMLEAAGHTVRLGGNIGVPPLSFLADLTADSWVVLELSSFQLIDLQTSPHIAVCLMVVPEHLDWHTDVAEYYQAKSQLFTRQSPDDIAIYFSGSDVAKQIASVGAAHKIPYLEAPGAEIIDSNVVIDGQTICRVDEIKLLGAHNVQNVCAAVTAVWQVTQDVAAMRSVITTFSGLEHRLELVATVNAVTYYDDSFGTTPETAIVAMQALSQPKVMILGGSDKGATYDALAEAVITNNVRHVIAIGKMGLPITRALLEHGYDNGISEAATMAEIVKTAHLVAEPGDVVLLSTGCASFDMFANYKDRGEQFQAAVRKLG